MVRLLHPISAREAGGPDAQRARFRDVPAAHATRQSVEGSEEADRVSTVSIVRVRTFSPERVAARTEHTGRRYDREGERRQAGSDRRRRAGERAPIRASTGDGRSGGRALSLLRGG